MRKEQITRILLDETNRTDYQVEDTRDYPTIIALYGNTSNCVNELITPSLNDFSQETDLSVGILEVDWSSATNYDEAVKIWKEQIGTYEVQKKNVIVLHNFTKLPAILGSRELQKTISGFLRKTVICGWDDNGWTGWHLILITDDTTDDGLNDQCWDYFRKKSCLSSYKI